MIFLIGEIMPTKKNKPHSIFNRLKGCLSILKTTPLHPQWLIFHTEESELQFISSTINGLIIDIGCGHQKIRNLVRQQDTYIGLDYYQTATQWYLSSPNLYADAQILPIRDNTADSVVLLDVLEHLPNPEKCIAEVSRIIKSQGIFILQIPFLYPIHDAPLDFQRWTIHGLHTLLSAHGFNIEKQDEFGAPLETAALLTNIALSKTVLNWLRARNILALFGILLVPLLIVTNNLFSFLLSKLSPTENLMPHTYRLICRKN